MKKGVHQGGILAAADIKERCFVDEESGCWNWRFSFNHGAPNVTFRLGGKKHNMRGKRAAKCVALGKLLDRRLECWGRVGCSAACVNPAHVMVGTPKQRGEYVSKHGLQKNVASRLAASRIGGIARRKLTQEQVDGIRASDKSTADLARALGVSRYAIYAVRVRRNWRGAALNSSVFAWRPAA